MELRDVGMCFVCGERNPIGMKAGFEIDQSNMSIRGSFTPGEAHQGYAGIMHGGRAAALLDEAMVKLLWEVGIPAVSALLEIRLVKPVRIGQTVIIKGYIGATRGKMIEARSSLESEDGTILAEAKGTCVRI